MRSLVEWFIGQGVKELDILCAAAYQTSRTTQCVGFSLWGRPLPAGARLAAGLHRARAHPLRAHAGVQSGTAVVKDEFLSALHFFLQTSEIPSCVLLWRGYRTPRSRSSA